MYRFREICIVVAFTSLARIVGESLMIHSSPAFFFFYKWRSACAHQFLFLRLGLVHSGSASWGDCGWVLFDKLHVSLFSLIGSHTMPEQHSQHTPTSLGQELNCPQTDTEDDHPILCKEVEAPEQSLKNEKSAGVNNMPAELVQAGREDVITALTTICNKIWQTGEWPTQWIQSLVITLSKKRNLQQCQNYQTISLISHLSKVMLKVIPKRPKQQAEKINAEEQAGFRAGRSTTAQIYNLQIPVRNISSTSKTSTMSS